VSLRGKVCVVTGASSGIGEATVRLLARGGARVVLSARREERLRAIADDIARRGGQAVPVTCDVTKKGDLRKLVAEVGKAYGRCDALVNNAGIPGGGLFTEVDLAQLDRVTTTNYLSVLWSTKLFLPLLRESRGHLVNVSSLAGRYALPGGAAYSATKHAVVALSEALYHELKPQGVMVTVVNPGLVETESFPQSGIKNDRVLGRFVMGPGRIASGIVDVIDRRRGPEISIPRWLGSLQATRLLAPPLYRTVMSRLVAPRNRPGVGERTD
jgi:short-subunit dehydrogenase